LAFELIGKFLPMAALQDSGILIDRKISNLEYFVLFFRIWCNIEFKEFILFLFHDRGIFILIREQKLLLFELLIDVFDGAYGLLGLVEIIVQH
jgi:hypothetical protein